MPLILTFIAVFLAFPLAHAEGERRYERFVISGAPTEAELKKFKEQRGALIVDLRGFDERGGDSVAATAGKLGLEYGKVDFDAQAETISPGMVAEIDKIVQQAGDKPVMLFCRSGNRASAYLATHLVRHQKMPADKALAIARNLGMSSSMESKVDTYLKRQDCQIFYATKSQLQNVRTSQEDIQSLGRVLNSAIRTSYEFLNMIDKATLGLASAMLLGTSLQSIKPIDWDKIQVTGSLLFQDQPFNVVPIRGAKMIFEADGKKQELVSGTKGEFAGNFYELVPYKRFRLFPNPILEFGEENKPTLKLPFKVTVESKICSGSFTVDHVPLEPVSVIAMNKPVDKP